MNSSKVLMVVGSIFVLVVISTVAGVVVTSGTTDSAMPATPPTQRTSVMPDHAETAKTPGDENDAKWKSRLTEEQYMVTRKKATEPPFSGKFWNHKDQGVYKCVCCETALFNSNTKFDSGTGWPSFYQPIDEKKIETLVDFSLFTQRTEVLCRGCKAHLGHVFEDAPQQPTGLRYCINSAALEFEAAPSQPKTGG